MVFLTILFPIRYYILHLTRLNQQKEKIIPQDDLDV